jgi:predicted nucleotidyltransferase
MRTSPILDALFPEVRGKILSSIFAQPGKEWYLSELAAFLRTRSSSLQREIESLHKAGILRQRRDGRRIYVSPDVHSPCFMELKSLFDKTSGLVPVLRDAFKQFDDGIELAFVYGSLARATETAESDIDLMVVGTPGLADLVPALRKLRRTLGRPVNPSVFSVKEFRRKARVGDHFLSAVLRGNKEFVKGNERELEAILRAF